MKIKWKRVGYHYNLPDMDITGVIDMAKLEQLCREQVEQFLTSSYGLRITVRVDLDGGPHRDLPFGYGTVEADG